MSLGVNVKRLRKDELKLSRVEFGKRLGVSSDVINNIELERLARPEQKEPLIRLICETFNVRYEWLTTGQGDIYSETKDSFVSRLSAEFALSDTARKIIEYYLNLDEARRAELDGFIKGCAEAIVSSPVENVVDEVIHQEEARYERATRIVHEKLAEVYGENSAGENKHCEK